MSSEPAIKKEGSFGLVEQFRKLAQRIALPSLTLTAVEHGASKAFQFELRNPWYTSVPVSTVMSIGLTINGYAIDEQNVEYVIREQAIPFSYARYLHEVIWGLGESVFVRIIDPKITEIIKEHNDVTFDLMLRTAFEGYHLPDNRINYPFNVEMEVSI